MAMELFQIFGRIGLNGVNEVNDQLEETSGNARQTSNGMSSAFKKIGAAVASYFAISKIKDFGKACVDAAADVAAEQAAFTQIMGDYSDEAQKKIDAIADATGITNSRMTPYMTSLTAKFKGLGFGIEDATGLAARGLNLAADGAAFWDMSLEETTSHLNSFINGSYEGGEAIGLFANDTQMALYAVEQGVIDDTKAWSSLDEATKQATRLEYAENMYLLSGATGQAAKESDAYLNVQGNLTEAWRQFKAEIGEPILETFVLPIMQKLANDVLPFLQEKIIDIVAWVKTAWENFKGWCEYLSDTFAPAFEAANTLFDTLKSAISGLIQPITDWISSGELASEMQSGLNTVIETFANWLTTAFEKINEFIIWLQSGSIGAESFKAAVIAVTAAIVAWKTVMEIGTLVANVVGWVKNLISAFSAFFTMLLANPIGLIIALTAGLVAAFIYLWNNCEEFRLFWINLWNEIKTVFGAVVEWLETTWNDLSTFFSGILDGISTFFSTTWSNISTTVTTIVSKISGVVNSVFTNVSTFVTTTWGAIKTAIETPINSAKEAVSSAIGTIQTTVSTIFDAVSSKVTTVWNGIKEAISTPINDAKQLVSDAIEAIKGFFNFEFTWPSLKLPHFSFSGSWNPFDWPDKFPKLGVEWYAKGGILNSPTLFGISPSGNAMVGGEAGAEAVAPIDTLMGYVKTAVKEETDGLNYNIQKLVSMLADYMPQIVDGIDRPLVLDSGAIVGGIAKNMDSKLGDINRMKGRGN